jgi:hypothetical protein
MRSTMPRGVEVVARDYGESQLLVVDEIRTPVQRTTDADVQAPALVDQPFLRCTTERRAVGVAGAEVGVPGVEVRVEVHDRDRAVPRGGRAQQRQRDGVVTADRQQPPRPFEQPTRAGLDLSQHLVDGERVHGDVAGVHDLEPIEGFDILGGVVRP